MSARTVTEKSVYLALFEKVYGTKGEPLEFDKLNIFDMHR